METEAPKTFDLENFARDVIQRSFETPVLVDFWAEWCGPCRFLGPILEKLVEDANGSWTLVKINTEEHQELALEWGVQGIPNLKLFSKGALIGELAGALPEADMKKWLEEHLPSERKEMLTQANIHLKNAEYAQATALLEAIHEEDPDHEETRLALAKSILWVDPGKACSLIQKLLHYPEATDINTLCKAIQLDDESLPDDPAKTSFTKGLLALKEQKYNHAFESFIHTITQNRNYLDDSAREICVALFHILGEDHEISKKWRSAFNMALY